MARRLPKLDARLAAAAALVRRGVCCADIGCDHGYLIAWLTASGQIPGGYACDVHEKPLAKAAFTLSEYGVRNRVGLICCNGLMGLQAGEVEDIVIAGMGGETIWGIIDAQPWTRDPKLRFILQPMTKADRLRRSLYQNGFVVLKETAVVSGDFPYAVMQVSYTGAPPCELDDAFALCGLLLDDHSPDARQYVAKAARLVREQYDGLKKAAASHMRLERCEALINCLEQGGI